MLPKISVILPIYNAEAYLEEALSCLLEQTFQDFELLALNDGSTDRSLEILNTHTDKRIRIISSEENRGLVHQLNKGIDKSKGKYILRMDADDTCVAERFQRQFDFMESHPEIGICGSYVKVFGNENWDWKMPLDHDSIRFTLLSGSAFAHNAVIMRKEVLEQYDLKYRKEAFPVEDYDLWLRMLENTIAANIPEYLTSYRIYGNQVTSTHNSAKNRLLKKYSRDSFETLFFRLNDHDIRLFEVFRGEKELERGQRREFVSFLNRIERYSQKSIGRKSLLSSLDRTLLMRIIPMKKRALLLLFPLHRRMFSRIKLMLKVYRK